METTFKITNTKLYVPIVTLSTKENVNLTKQLNEGSSSSYKKKSRNLDDDDLTRFYLDVFFQEVKRLFVLAFNNISIIVLNDFNNLMNNTSNRVARDSQKNYSKSKYNRLQCIN